MDVLKNTTILNFHNDTLESVRKMYNFEKPGEMNKAIDILEEWIKKQNHFSKKDYSRYYLERSIIMCKGSVERAKARMDKVCTLRTLMPHYFQDKDPKEINNYISTVVHHGFLSNLTKDHNRVFMLKNFGKQFEVEMLLQCYKLYVLGLEYVNLHDYANGYILLLDYNEVNLTELIKKMGPFELRQIMMLLTEGYGMRVKGMHILTQSKMIDTIVMLFKQVMPPKIASRIQVHKTLDTLYDYVPKDILPIEYGGKEKPIAELNNDLFNEVSTEEFRKYWKEMCQASTDESRRQKDKFNEQYMGMPGTFRTLNVD